MNINLGISAGFAVKRWPDPRDWVKMVKEELGLNICQFSFDLLDPRADKSYINRYCELTRETCQTYEVTLHSTFTGLSIYSHNLLYHPLPEGRKDGMNWFDNAFKMTEKLDISAAGGPFGGMDVLSFEHLGKRTYLEEQGEQALVDLLDLAGKYGIKDFYWESTPVRREGTVTINETIDFIEKINAKARKGAAQFSLCLDVGHATSPFALGKDRDPYRWIEETASHTSIIHLQQSDGCLDRHWPFTQKYNEKGIIEPEKVVTALANTGKKTIDLFLEIGHPFEEEDDTVKDELIESVFYWKQALGKQGITFDGGHPIEK